MLQTLEQALEPLEAMEALIGDIQYINIWEFAQYACINGLSDQKTIYQNSVYNTSDA